MSTEKRALFYQKLGLQIRKHRKKAQLSQEELAEHLGYTRISIVNIEKGQQKLQLHTLFELAVYLDIHVGEILSPLETLFEKEHVKKNQKSQLSVDDLRKGLGQIQDKQVASDKLAEFLKFTQYKK